MRARFYVIHGRWAAAVFMACALVSFGIGMAAGRGFHFNMPNDAAVVVFSAYTVPPATTSTPSPDAESSADVLQIRLLDTPSPTETPQVPFEVSVLSRTPVSSDMKRILIYHSHTYEAYQATERYPYVPTETWRTADSARNVVRVGAELTALLGAMGYDVTHDTGAYEPPNLSGAYARSLHMLEARQNAGEVYDLYIDLHRDAYVEGAYAVNALSFGGERLARIALLVGKGTGLTGDQYAVKPNWTHNLQIAEAITASLDTQADGLARNVIIKTGRFNQHVADGCILVEVGNNRNTLEEALASMPYLAAAIAETLK